MAEASPLLRVPEATWPPDALETVPACPVCRDSSREPLHAGLMDKVFFCAAGEWQLWNCCGCGSAYLDPRPTSDSIGLAYQEYYTHRAATEKPAYESLSGLRKLRRRLVNGYTNLRFSTNEQPSSAWGALLPLLRSAHVRLLHEYRHLPKRVPPGGRLLDVGCGNGSFLTVAEGCGWRCSGVDPDPKSVAAARAAGLDVRQGGLEVYGGCERAFDVVTMSHAIEHLHDPVKALADVNRLLKPGGQLWIETPNIESAGHKRFGKHWRGLEPPRHLVLFSPSSLRKTLEANGFRAISWRSAPSPLRGMVQSSHAVRLGVPYSAAPSPRQLQILATQVLQFVVPARREFILFVASKEGGIG